MKATPANYRLYGLRLRSPFALPCPRVSVRVRPDVELRAGAPRQFARARAALPTARTKRDWFTCRRLEQGERYLSWTGLFEFLLSADGRRILYYRQEQASLESFSVYLLGQVLSFSLLAFGTEPLHGTAVTVDGGAVAFLGDCGYGKSTLGAALLARGFPMISDDLIALEEHDAGWAVHPGIPRIKLFPSVARRVLGPDSKSAPKGTPMNSRTSKLVLPLNADQVARQAVPLRALYTLSEPRRSRSVGPARVQIEPVSGPKAFLEVIRAAFNLLVIERPRLANQFDFATRLVADVPVRRLTYPRNLSLLPAVCDAVLADLGASNA